MSLYDDLKEFIGDTVVTREVEFKGKKKEFHFLELGAGESEDFFLGIEKEKKKIKDDLDKNRGLRSKVLEKILCTKDGKPAITAEEADAIPLKLANTLQEIALDVNGLTQKAQEEAKNA